MMRIRKNCFENISLLAFSTVLISAWQAVLCIVFVHFFLFVFFVLFVRSAQSAPQLDPDSAKEIVGPATEKFKAAYSRYQVFKQQHKILEAQKECADMVGLLLKCPSIVQERYSPVFYEDSIYQESLKKYSRGVDEIELYLKLSPENYQGYGVAQRICGEAGRFDRARDYATRAIRAFQVQPGNYQTRALCRVISGDVSGAARDTVEAIRWNFGNEHKEDIICNDAFLKSVREALLREERHGGAIATSEMGSGVADLFAKQYGKAVAEFSQAISHSPAMWQSLILRAECNSRLGNNQSALKDANAACDIAPNEECNYIILERCYIANRSPELLLVNLQKRIAKGQPNKVILVAQGLAYEHLRKDEKALDSYGRALQIDPKDVEALLCRAKLRQEMAQLDKAISDLTRAVQVDPKDYRAYRDRASCYFELAEYRDAIADLTRVIELTDDPKAVAARKECYAHLEKESVSKQAK